MLLTIDRSLLNPVMADHKTVFKKKSGKRVVDEDENEEESQMIIKNVRSLRRSLPKKSKSPLVEFSSPELSSTGS
jgi:hypothetical protein